jgi:hypothetical protein
MTCTIRLAILEKEKVLCHAGDHASHISTLFLCLDTLDRPS